MNIFCNSIFSLFFCLYLSPTHSLFTIDKGFYCKYFYIHSFNLKLGNLPSSFFAWKEKDRVGCHSFLVFALTFCMSIASVKCMHVQQWPCTTSFKHQTPLSVSQFVISPRSSSYSSALLSGLKHVSFFLNLSLTLFPFNIFVDSTDQRK